MVKIIPKNPTKIKNNRLKLQKIEIYIYCEFSLFSNKYKYQFFEVSIYHKEMSGNNVKENQKLGKFWLGLKNMFLRRVVLFLKCTENTYVLYFSLEEKIQNASQKKP